MIRKRGYLIVDAILGEVHLRRSKRHVHVDVRADAGDGIVVVGDGRRHVVTVHPQVLGGIAFIGLEGQHGRRVFIEVGRPRVVADDGIVVDDHLALACHVDRQDILVDGYLLILGHQRRILLDILDGVLVFGQLRRDVQFVEHDLLDTPFLGWAEGDEGIQAVLNPEGGGGVFYRLVLKVDCTLTDGHDHQAIVNALIGHAHRVVLVEIGDGIFAEAGLLRGQRVSGIDVCEETVGDDLVVDRHVHDLVALVRQEGHHHGVTFHKGQFEAFIPHGQRVVGLQVQVDGLAQQRIALADGLTVTLRDDGHLVFAADDLHEGLGPALLFQERGPGSFGHLQDGFLVDTLKHAQIDVEWLRKCYLHPLQTVAVLEGGFLNLLHSGRQSERIQTGTTLEGRLTNLFHRVGYRH